MKFLLPLLLCATILAPAGAKPLGKICGLPVPKSAKETIARRDVNRVTYIQDKIKSEIDRFEATLNEEANEGADLYVSRDYYGKNDCKVGQAVADYFKQRGWTTTTEGSTDYPPYLRLIVQE